MVAGERGPVSQFGDAMINFASTYCESCGWIGCKTITERQARDPETVDRIRREVLEAHVRRTHALSREPVEECL